MYTHIQINKTNSIVDQFRITILPTTIPYAI